jgi:hypothetical protein
VTYRLADHPSTSVTAVIAAAPEAIWPIVTDINFPARHSREFRGADWLDGATGPALRGRFEGRNANAMLGEWTTVSTVSEYREPEAFSWAVGDPHRPLAEWGFALRTVGGGTEVRQWYRLGPGESGMTWVVGREPEREHELIERRFAGQRRNMSANLGGIATALGAAITWPAETTDQT